ncbi:core-binding factor subunit beta isoform X2 [Pelodiscus sinensis]|uniref:core-binding factor subunit beta isoform X2 n=1 Tax=Pelodiscus sinensis TaxID=13735 RepID=UPI003F6D757F
MPRVVPDQRSKFENEEFFRKLSRECEIKYTGFRDRPHEERQARFQNACRDGRSEIVYLKAPMILNGVCVIWKGWIDLQRLDGMGCLEFDEERAQQEDALAQQAFEEARRRTREFEDRDRSHREEMELFRLGGTGGTDRVSQKGCKWRNTASAHERSSRGYCYRKISGVALGRAQHLSVEHPEGHISKNRCYYIAAVLSYNAYGLLQMIKGFGPVASFGNVTCRKHSSTDMHVADLHLLPDVLILLEPSACGNVCSLFCINFNSMECSCTFALKALLNVTSTKGFLERRWESRENSAVKQVPYLNT